MAGTFHFELVSPEKQLVAADIPEAIIPGTHRTSSSSIIKQLRRDTTQIACAQVTTRQARILKNLSTISALCANLEKTGHIGVRHGDVQSDVYLGRFRCAWNTLM